MSLLLVGGAAYVFIALKAFQQLNVVHSNYLAVLPTSMLMAATEICVISGIVSEGYWAILPFGLGGGLGCVTSMAIHSWVRRRKKKREGALWDTDQTT